MSRFLFTVQPLAGHVNPTIAIGAALTARGHEVAWAGSEAALRPLLGPAATIFPTGSRLYRDQGRQGAYAMKTLWQSFIVPFTRFTLPAIDRAVQDWRPDAVLVDQHAPAGALVAHRHGLPWVTLAPSSLELARPFAALPRVEEWVRERMADLWRIAGLPAAEFFDYRFSPHLLLAFTTPALTGPMPIPDHWALVGPVLAPRPPEPGFPWHRVDPDRRKVLVCMGTLVPEHAVAFYPRAAEALAALHPEVQGIVVAPDGAVPDPPEHLVVTRRVPMLELMPHLDAVVCHGGMNTVCEALAEGVPLVMAPLINDQPITAQQVVAAGAGIRVHAARVTPDGLRTAVRALLDDPAYRAGARRVRDDFAAAGGAELAADRLECLVPRPSPRSAAPEPTIVGGGASPLA
ncbi:MAG TPA: glycosyltransferase [Pseudonocardiaceae bacterium]